MASECGHRAKQRLLERLVARLVVFDETEEARADFLVCEFVPGVAEFVAIDALPQLARIPAQRSDGAVTGDNNTSFLIHDEGPTQSMLIRCRDFEACARRRGQTRLLVATPETPACRASRSTHARSAMDLRLRSVRATRSPARR